ncbi:MAG: hypothetical protein Ct9H300mP31_18550 [Acidimicrobiaceae bacterium]|nr:MAG: hypothetical protein Ct9H300mP31_18550 [Acidimicrobiaceae bacterium]
MLRRLLADLVAATLEAATERRHAGTLVFHDLLVIARDLLADPIVGDAVRTSLHERYRRVLLDEFQDTDPLQLELALLLTDPDSPVRPPSTPATSPPTPVPSSSSAIRSSPSTGSAGPTSPCTCAPAAPWTPPWWR